MVVKAPASQQGGHGFKPRPGLSKDFKNGPTAFLPGA